MVSDPDQNGLRLLRIEEDAFVRALLQHVTDSERLLRQLDRAQVRDLDDGGMGSLEFAGDGARSLGCCLVKTSYLDSDGIPVSIALNLDTNGQLYELDMWRVDFAPLQQYPDFERSTIEIVRRRVAGRRQVLVPKLRNPCRQLTLEKRNTSNQPQCRITQSPFE